MNFEKVIHIRDKRNIETEQKCIHYKVNMKQVLAYTLSGAINLYNLSEGQFDIYQHKKIHRNFDLSITLCI